MSDYGSDNSDDEYGPIVSAWGEQKGSNNAAENESTLSSWHSLTDPNAKIGPNGLGTGGLHRQGKNYKPIEEQLILEHRKKGTPQGKKSSLTADKGTPSLRGKGRKPDKQKPSQRGHSHTNHKSSTNSSKTPTGNTRFSRPIRQSNQASSEGRAQQRDTSHTSSQAASGRQQQSWSKLSPQTGHPDNKPMWMPPVYSCYDASQSTPQPPRHTSRSTAPSSSHPPITNRPPPSGSSWSNQPLVERPFWETGAARSAERSPSPVELQLKSEKKPDRPMERLIDDLKSWSPMPERGTSADSSMPRTPPAETCGASDIKSPVKPKKDNGWSPAHEWGAAAATSWGANQNYDSGNSSNASVASTAAGNGWKDAIGATHGWATDMSSSHAGNDPKQQQIDDHQQHGRFSNPSRPRYSTRNGSKPVPANYRRDAPLIPPAKTADPPKMDNPVIVSINVELGQGTKIPISIRLHDDPSKLAHQFGRDHQLDSPAVIDALRDLFQTQKTNAMKKRRNRIVNTF